MVLGAAAAGAAVCALVAQFGGVPKLQPLVGLIVIMAVAYALSTNRRAIDRRTVAWGLALQVVFALLVLKTTPGQAVFQRLGAAINRLLDFAFVGSSFVFGPLGDKEVWPRIMTAVLGPEGARYGVVFAFQVLPTIIFIAALFAILYYFGVMQVVVRLFAMMMRRVMRASGAESLNVAASIFMGQTEAPLTIRPFLPRMTESELMTVMTVRHGAHLGRHHGRLHPVRHRGAAPADGGHHDRAGHADDGQDLRARDRAAGDDGDREAARSSGPTSTSSTPPGAAPAKGCRWR